LKERSHDTLKELKTRTSNEEGLERVVFAKLINVDTLEINKWACHAQCIVQC
jgi:hypothetical protein